MKPYVTIFKATAPNAKSEFDSSKSDSGRQRFQFSWETTQTLRDDPFFEVESAVLLDPGVRRAAR